MISGDPVEGGKRGTEQLEAKAEEAELGRQVQTAAALNPKPQFRPDLTRPISPYYRSF